VINTIAFDDSHNESHAVREKNHPSKKSFFLIDWGLNEVPISLPYARTLGTGAKGLAPGF
jgi:hypothetical protein